MNETVKCQMAIIKNYYQLIEVEKSFIRVEQTETENRMKKIKTEKSSNRKTERI